MKNNIMEYSIKEMFNELEKSMKEHMINPKIVPMHKRNLSYFKLINKNPAHLEPHQIKNLEEIENLKNMSEDNECIHLSSNNDILIAKKSEVSQSGSEKGGQILIPKVVSFSGHSGFSFYEILARKILFQVFNNHQMYYFVKFKIPESKIKFCEKRFVIGFLANTYLLKLQKSYQEDFKTEKIKEKKYII